MSTNAKAVVSFLYPRKGMTHFDKDYYLKHHIPATDSAWGSLGMTSCVVYETGDGAEYAINTLTFWKDLVSWEAVKDGEAAQRLVMDIKNFTNVKAVTIVGKVMN